MPAPPLETIDGSQIHLIAEIIRDLTAKGAGWFNLSPDIPNGVPVPATPGAFAIFSKRGPAVPVVTWTAPTRRGSRSERPSQVGIQHGRSQRIGQVFDEMGIAPPDGWTLVSDNPRRGFVAEIHTPSEPEALASWLCDVATRLSIPPTTGNYVLRRYVRD